jgi:hypothetical protein
MNEATLPSFEYGGFYEEVLKHLNPKTREESARSLVVV